jgi:hypothetical protein
MTTITSTAHEDACIAFIEELHASDREIISDSYDRLWQAEQELDLVDDTDEEGFRAAVEALSAARSAYREALA